MLSDSSEVLKFIKDTDVKFLDIRFTDLPGVQQHFNIPASTVDEEFFSVGQLFDGSSIRVPTPNVSVVDLTFTPSRETTKEEVNAVLKAAAEGALKGVLGYTEEPLVSIDFNHNAASSTIDSLETAVIDGKLVRVLSWYDNEWGFSNRMIDTAGVIAKFL